MSPRRSRSRRPSSSALTIARSGRLARRRCGTRSGNTRNARRLLGFYDQANPEVADWETKWAVEHGISFFVYCWYRAGKADAVETKYSSAIEALLKSRYVSQFKFTIMWENQPRGGRVGHLRRRRREGPARHPAALLDYELLQPSQLPQGG